MRTITEYEMTDYDAFRESLTADDVVKALPTIARGWLPDYNYIGTEDDFEAFKNQMIMRKAVEIIKDYCVNHKET